MTRTCTAQDGDRAPNRDVRRVVTWGARALVLGGLVLALVSTTGALGLDMDTEHLGPLWVAAIAWTVVAGLAGALWRGLRHHDWSDFSGWELPEDNGDREE